MPERPSKQHHGAPPPARSSRPGPDEAPPEAAGPADVTTETVVSDLVLAKLAAHTALHTDGVARLEPGVAGMMSRLGRWGREHATGRPELPHEGVHARTDHDGVHLHLDIVTTGSHRAADVAHHLRAAVAENLTAATGATVAAVTVTVLDIDTTDGLLTDPGPHAGARSEPDQRPHPRSVTLEDGP